MSTFKLDDSAAVARHSAAEAAAAFAVSCFAWSGLTWVQVCGLLEVHVVAVALLASLTAFLLTIADEGRRSASANLPQWALIIFIASSSGAILGMVFVGFTDPPWSTELLTWPRLISLLVWSSSLFIVRCGLLWTCDNSNGYRVEAASAGGGMSRMLEGKTSQFGLVSAEHGLKLHHETADLIDLELYQKLCFDWQEAVAMQERRHVEVVMRRASDVVVSLILILFTLPLMAMTALLIKVDSPGPFLYRQERVGIGGRVFTILKFRSMTMNAERGEPVWAAQRDSRVTRVGRIIRFARIDELPQLFNVLKGEMSLVGPRPERPHFVSRLVEQIPLYAERFLVRPGVTGWAQVKYPYGASVEDARNKLCYDLFYIKCRSLWLDWRILLATVRVVLFGIGAR